MSRFYDALRRAEGNEGASAEGVPLATPVRSRSLNPRERDASNLATVVVPSPDGRGSTTEPAELFPGEVLPLRQSGLAVHPAAYERIIQRLLVYRRRARKNVILVASAVPKEGASTVVRTLAHCLAQNQNERVLLVDANLRDPVQHVEFHTGRADGLTDVLMNEASLSAAVKPAMGAAPALLACGRPTSSPPHLLTQSAFYGVVSALKTEFDWVFIDGPPLTTYPDSGSLAAASGGAVLVLRAEKTRWEVADEARRVLESSGVDILGAVLNRRRYHIPEFLYKRL